MVLGRELGAAGVGRQRRHQRRGVAVLAQLALVEVALAGDPGAFLDVVFFAGAHRHLRVGPVGKPVENALPLGSDLGQLDFQFPAALAQFLPPRPRRVGVALAQLRQLVLLGVERVELTLQAAALFVEHEPAVQVGFLRIDFAPADRLAHALRVFADLSGVNHGSPKSEVRSPKSAV